MDINVEIAPAMNIADTTQANVWWIAYHCSKRKASRMAFWTFALPNGREYAIRKIPTNQANFFHSFNYLFPDNMRKKVLNVFVIHSFLFVFEKYLPPSHKATFTNPIKTGTSTKGPITAAKAAP